MGVLSADGGSPIFAFPHAEGTEGGVVLRHQLMGEVAAPGVYSREHEHRTADNETIVRTTIGNTIWWATRIVRGYLWFQLP